jgi:hypothetical protein
MDTTLFSCSKTVINKNLKSDSTLSCFGFIITAKKNQMSKIRVQQLLTKLNSIPKQIGCGEITYKKADVRL